MVEAEEVASGVDFMVAGTWAAEEMDMEGAVVPLGLPPLSTKQTAFN